MRKFVGLVSCIILSALSLSAQSKGNISGKLVDAATKEPIIGAVIELSNTASPQSKSHFTTEADGMINLRSLNYGEYKLSISFLGYKTLERTVRVRNSNNDLGTLQMQSETLKIDQVTLEVPAMRTSLKGDTVSYNASAFKVAADADTEGLLSKMPGITVSNGTLEAHGEEVKKVLVDGKEFFGDDVSTAIKNLPAEVVERIEVYNKLSDQAEFTGMDDGEGYKAINIVTSADKRSGQFGKLYGAYGFNEKEADKYIVGGNVNIFQGDSRLSLIGLFNNLNQQNFSFEDILGVTGSAASSGGGRMGGGFGSTRGFMVRPQEGIATVQAVGLNYSDTWGKKDKVQFSGSYFFNHTDTRNSSSTQKWEYDEDKISFTNSDGSSSTGNYNHRFNARIDYQINSNHNIMIRPSFSYQSYDTYSRTLSEQTSTENGVESEVMRRNVITDYDRHGFNGGLNALYRVKLGKPGRTMTLNIDGNARKNDLLSYPETWVFRPPYDPDVYTLDKSEKDNNTMTYRLRGGVTYTEPIGEKSQLSAEYNIRYNYSDADQRVYQWLEPQAMFDEQIDEMLSSIYNSGYLTQSIGPGYRYSNKKVTISTSVSYQNAVMKNIQEMPVSMSGERKYHFNNVVYSAMANFNFDTANSLRIHARSSTNNPSVSELTEVPDMTRTRYVTAGNASLKPNYGNRIMANYVKSNVLKGRTFTAMIGTELTSNYIADSIVMNNPGFIIPNYDGTTTLGAGNQYTKPINMDGRYRIFTGLSYGFPVKFIKSNLNVDLGGMFGQTPSMINGKTHKMNEQYYNGGLTLSSNISENVDFTIRYRGGYGIVNSSTLQDGETTKVSNESFTQNLSASIKWVFWKGFTFSGNATYSQDRGITDDYNEEYIICNLYVGKKIFKNQRGEISFGANDLLDQNRSFRRTVESNSITNSRNTAIGRYYAVQFIYNLRNFGKKASRNGKDYDGLDQQSNGSVGVQRSTTRSGPPPGGFGGPPPGGGFRP